MSSSCTMFWHLLFLPGSDNKRDMKPVIHCMCNCIRKKMKGVWTSKRLVDFRCFRYSKQIINKSFNSTFHTLTTFSFGSNTKRRTTRTPTYLPPLVNAVIFCIFIPCLYAIDYTKFTCIREHARLGSLDTGFVVLSLLDCSTSCSSTAACDGFNFYKTGVLSSQRECMFLTYDEISSGVLTSLHNTYVYIKIVHVDIFEQGQVRINHRKILLYSPVLKEMKIVELRYRIVLPILQLRNEGSNFRKANKEIGET